MYKEVADGGLEFQIVIDFLKPTYGYLRVRDQSEDRVDISITCAFFGVLEYCLMRNIRDAHQVLESTCFVGTKDMVCRGRNIDDEMVVDGP